MTNYVNMCGILRKTKMGERMNEWQSFPSLQHTEQLQIAMHSFSKLITDTKFY